MEGGIGNNLSCTSYTFAAQTKPFSEPTAEETPPVEVPPTAPKKPPDVEVEDVEEFPGDEA